MMERLATRCRRCGKKIGAALFVGGREDCTCEGCYLRGHQSHAIEQVEAAHQELVEALAAALDLRERETGLHSKRVACHTLVLAKRFTQEHGQLRQVYWGALLHDIGKIGVPDAILLKPGPLTAAEEQVMRSHPENGEAILRDVQFLREAAEIVLCHEERFDGSGYPRGLAREAIPLGARLFAVIDTLDAMTSDRPYRKGVPFDAARSEIARLAGRQFDPRAVEAFLTEEETLRAMVALKCQVSPDTSQQRAATGDAAVALAARQGD